MRHQSQNPTHLFAAFPAALRGGAADGSRDGPPPGGCGIGAMGRYDDRHLTSAPASGAYNLPAASGQRPAASGQRPAASGQRPAASGQRPAASGQRPAASGQRPAASGQRPAASGHDVRPAPDRGAQAGSLDIDRLATA